MTNAFDVQRQRIAETLRTQQTTLQAQQRAAEEQTRTQARTHISGVEVQKQQILSDLYKQEEMAKRRMALGLPYISQAENIRKLEEEAKRVTGMTEGELNKALTDIKAQAVTAKQALKEWKATSLTEVAQQEETFKAENVELNTGEFVPREKFEAYTPEYQTKLTTLGVDKFNKLIEKEQKEFEATNVEVRPNEWIPKEQYEALSSSDQTRLKEIGYKAWQKEFEVKNVQVSTDKWMPLESWSTLAPEDQVRIKEVGYDTWQAEWQAKHVEAAPDKWFVKSVWETLTPKQQQELLTTGSYTATPPTKEEALQQFKTMQTEGKIPEAATFVDYKRDTGEIEYTITPTEVDWRKLFFQQPQNIQQSYIFRQAPYLGMRSWSQLSDNEKKQILNDFAKEFDYLGSLLSLPKEKQVELAKGMLLRTVPAAVLMGVTVLVTKAPMPSLVNTVLMDVINAGWIGLGTYGLTNTIKTVLPDPNVPTWQKGLDIALNVGFIAAGVYGLGTLGQTTALPAKVRAAAREAGVAANELQAATKDAAKAASVGAVETPGLIPGTTRYIPARESPLLPSDVASRLQLAQANVISADTKLAASLSGLRLTSKQIATLEKLSGYQGLEPLIESIGDASKELSTAWDTASATAKMYGSSSGLYIKTLEKVTAAKANLDVALRNLQNALQPRFKVGTPATFESQWQAILKDTRAALKDAEAAYDEAKMNIYNPAGRLNELSTKVISTRQSLENLQSMYKAGVDPTVTGYKISWSGTQLGAPEGPAPKGGFGEGGTMSEEFYRQQYDRMVSSWKTPEPYEASPGATSPRMSTALKQEVLSELAELETPTASRLTLIPKVLEELPRTEMGVPTLTGVGLGALTPVIVTSITNAARALVTAGSPALEEWVSPQVITTPEIIKATEEATRAVTQISSVTTPEVVAITETALRAAVEAATKGLTIPEISLVAQNAIRSSVQSLTESGAITQTQAQTLTQTAVQVATQVATQAVTQVQTQPVKMLVRTLTQPQGVMEKSKRKPKTKVKTLTEGEHVMTYTPPEDSEYEPFAVIGRRVPFEGILTTRVEIPVEVEVEKPLYTPIIVETPIPMRIETAIPVLVTSEEVIEGEYEELTEPIKPSKPKTLDIGIYIEPIDLNLSPFDFTIEPIVFDTGHSDVLSTPKPKKQQAKQTRQEVREFRIT